MISPVFDFSLSSSYNIKVWFDIILLLRESVKEKIQMQNTMYVSKSEFSIW